MERKEIHPQKWPLSSQFDISGFVWFGISRYTFRCDFRLCTFIEFYFEHKEQVSKKPSMLGAVKIYNFQNVILCSKKFNWGDKYLNNQTIRSGLKTLKHIYKNATSLARLRKNLQPTLQVISDNQSKKAKWNCFAHTDLTFPHL